MERKFGFLTDRATWRILQPVEGDRISMFGTPRAPKAATNPLRDLLEDPHEDAYL